MIATAAGLVFSRGGLIVAGAAAIAFLVWRLDAESAARDAAEARAAMLVQQMAAIEHVAEADAQIRTIIDNAARAIEETDDAPLSDPERAALRCLRDPAACNLPALADDGGAGAGRPRP